MAWQKILLGVLPASASQVMTLIIWLLANVGKHNAGLIMPSWLLTIGILVLLPNFVPSHYLCHRRVLGVQNLCMSQVFYFRIVIYDGCRLSLGHISDGRAGWKANGWAKHGSILKHLPSKPSCVVRWEIRGHCSLATYKVRSHILCFAL